MKKSMVFLLVCLATIPLFASNVVSTWYWTLSDPLVTSFRYQVDGEAEDKWTVVDSTQRSYTSKPLDGSSFHEFHLQQSYDGIHWGPSAVMSTSQADKADTPVVQDEPCSNRFRFSLGVALGANVLLTAQKPITSQMTNLEWGLDAVLHNIFRFGKNHGISLEVTGAYEPYPANEWSKAFSDWQWVDMLSGTALLAYELSYAHLSFRFGLGGFLQYWMGTPPSSWTGDRRITLYGLAFRTSIQWNVTKTFHVGMGITCRYYLYGFYFGTSEHLEEDFGQVSGPGSVTLGGNFLIGFSL